MDLHDYLIDQSGKDWQELLLDWSPPLPSSFQVWMVNRFGDLFVAFDDRSIHMLDVGASTLTRVADDREHFADLADLDDNANNWFLINLVDQCVAAGKVLKSNQCYGYKMPPILGGEYSVENTVPTDLAVHYSFLADIYRQTKDLPNGSRIRVVAK